MKSIDLQTGRTSYSHVYTLCTTGKANLTVAHPGFGKGGGVAYKLGEAPPIFGHFMLIGV